MKINSLKIEMLLGERGLTKAKLSEISGVSRQNISTIIRRGTCEPKTAAKIADGLNVSIAVIVEV